MAFVIRESGNKARTGSYERFPFNQYPAFNLPFSKILGSISNFLLAIGIGTLALPTYSHALDAAENGQWISLGAPKYVHMGTDGRFYLNGTHHGYCDNVKPQYFRIDMNAERFQEFYSWLLFAAAKGNPLDCRVASGCGLNSIWVEYCRGSLQ